MTYHSVPIQVKWQKQKFSISIDKNQPIRVFQEELYRLTQVPPERQTILGFKGGKLTKDKDWDSCGLKENMSIVLIGSADEVPKAPTSVQFIEDVAPHGEDSLQLWDGLPCGMVNVGNTCYMNATVQCLSTADYLLHSIREYCKQHPSPRTASEKLVSALFQVFVSLHTTPCIGPVVPMELLQQLRNVNPQFQERNNHGVYCQQDAEECWSTLLAQCHQVLVSPSLLSMSSFPLGDSVIDFLFGVELETIDTCLESSDEQPRKRKEVVRSLKCHISHNTSYLEQGLKEGLETTIELTAETLGKSVGWSRKSRISRMPPYLCIQFVRFFWKATEQVKAKILRNVSFPVLLNLYDFATNELKQNIEKQSDSQFSCDNHDDDVGNAVDWNTQSHYGHYELSAVLTHQGRAADSGHYVAWVKRDKSWYKLDDDKVSLD
ncbi:ubiquitin carboxyl-terminal hydrolase 14 [Galdieria sulphuraria]|uniref:Ubiquitin carboxyl-terminal hydrolase n=1 Tax=Galdieria sulphuraria TaxID=130081 RepID=M2Y966_GALSU|nr:ubiquitin carboxyl-terminal hydrolase 14 [Galdieria sulphuraria]EME32638.1 ubiquitin carboxyl-terminal hydrolase 14 [Galdieria sulphuraria]|eukprot:XP_005709158.1 ubiquitin carboxyl-terminal hydrolase 14 [Galdieria sulphuraria]